MLSDIQCCCCCGGVHMKKTVWTWPICVVAVVLQSLTDLTAPYILCSLTEADEHRKNLHSICLKTSKARTVSGPRPRTLGSRPRPRTWLPRPRPRPRTWLPRPRPRPRTRQLASRRLEAKAVASRTPSLTGPPQT